MKRTGWALLQVAPLTLPSPPPPVMSPSSGAELVSSRALLMRRFDACQQSALGRVVGLSVVSGGGKKRTNLGGCLMLINAS